MLVQVINNGEPVKKSRIVEVYKNKVYNDIDLYTHKQVDASLSPDVKSRNAISSDTEEEVDGAIISRAVQFRDSELRGKIQFALADDDIYYADDSITLEEEKFTYRLSLDEGFNDNILKPLAEYIHRYLVFGALEDWYTHIGLHEQAAAYGRRLKEADGKINSSLRSRSAAKRPLQPFGPAQKIF